MPIHVVDQVCVASTITSSLLTLEICNLINVVMHEIQYAGLQATLQGSCLCLKLFLENPPRIFYIKYIATT